MTAIPTPFRRFARIVGLTLVLSSSWAVSQAAEPAFDFEQLSELARKNAQSAYRPDPGKLPTELAELDYDDFRKLRFQPTKALWRNAQLPFEAMFFHLGKLNRQPVRIHEVSSQGVRNIPYRSDWFDFGTAPLQPKGWGDLGFAGLRVHYPFVNNGYKDELIAFQGASYFRALGKGQQYGLSASGLGIDTAGGSGEEFPAFTDFWLEQPAPDAKSLTILALLDSPRATGAYRFEVTPGSETVTRVRSRIFLRAGAGNRSPRWA